ncbi:MAG: S8 family peptidase [Eubacteriales bacterium]|nr:S8 family peptidase [Eubacteriales bacterium]MDD4421717.1 S8 family peptidase [Eubacteriales bacterium]HBR32962.1 peptidase [Clostridiales bacterium]
MTKQEKIDFINQPDTIGFVIRDSPKIRKFFEERSSLVTTITFSDRYLVAYTSTSNYSQLLSDLGTGAISSISLILGLLDRANIEAAGILQVQQQPFLDLRGRGVLIGIIDTGIDYTKNAFIYEDGTSKIYSIYDLTINENPPDGFYVGTEYTKEQINKALRSPNPLEIVPSTDTNGHGTFLASVAAGREEGDLIGAAPDSELIVVKLRKAKQFFLDLFAILPEQENAFESLSVMAAVEYIVQTAQRINRPVAICIGLGTNLGGHDGFTIFEEYLSSVSIKTGVCLCAAAGNESQARHHMQGTIKDINNPVPIEFRVGENAGDIFLSVYNSASDRISVAIRSPTGELIDRIPAKNAVFFETNLVLERTNIRVAYFFPLEQSGGQATTVRIGNATPGIWTILVYADILLDGEFHSWLPLTGLVSPTVEFLNPSPSHTVVVPSTTVGIISCGAYDSVSNSLYERSSWGPTRLPVIAPDFTAPGVNISGVYPTGVGTMSGTSVAAAITTGACALLLQWGIVDGFDISMSTFEAKAFLIRGCMRDPDVVYPNIQWGYGRINLIQTFNLMREL